VNMRGKWKRYALKREHARETEKMRAQT